VPRVPAPDHEDLEDQGVGEILLPEMQHRNDSKPAAKEKVVAMKRKPNFASALIIAAVAAVGSCLVVLIGMIHILDFILKRLSGRR